MGGAVMKPLVVVVLSAVSWGGAKAIYYKSTICVFTHRFYHHAVP
jgi:hypothetical protein